MRMPFVDRYMTREPYSISSTESLSRARQLMQGHAIRHLPVIDGERLVGILAEHDIGVVEAIPGTRLDQVEVARVMSPPLDVWSETPLDEVSAFMKQRKADCVVVKGGAGVEGIFTAVDAFDALTELLRRATT